MPGFKIILDPDEVPLEFVPDDDGIAGFFLLAPLKVPPPQKDAQWTSNADSEGDLSSGGKDKNIEIPPKLRIVGADEADFRVRQIQLEQKVGKFTTEGGVLRLVYPDGQWIDYEVRGVTGGDRLFDNRFLHNWRTEDEITFVCGPFGVGQEIALGEFSGSGRVLECVIEDVPGTAPALARAEVVSPERDIWELLWGRESRRFSDADTAEVFYPASAMTPLAGAKATTATIDGKAGVSVVRQEALSPSWAAQLSTELPGVGHLTHEGVYELYVWVHTPTANVGEVGVMVEYGVGDLQQRTPLEPGYFEAGHPREGKVMRFNAGQVFLRGGARGDHQWEARVLSRSSIANDDFDILGIGLRPLEEGNSRIAVTPALRQPTALLVRDEFNQSGGALNGKIIAAAGSVSGPKNPSTVVEDTSEGAHYWENPGNAAGAPNGTYANTGSKHVEGKGVSAMILKSTGPGFAIPGTATIDGVEVGLLRKSSQGYSYIAYENRYDYFTVLDEWVRLVKAGAYVGDQKKAGGEWPTSPAWARYGGARDLWGTTWTPAQINAPDFGVALKAKPKFGSTDASGFPVLYVDAFEITVYYTDAAGQKWATTGDPTDIQVDEASDTATRSEVNDSSLSEGRFATAGSSVTSDIVVGVATKRSSMIAGSGERLQGGVLARYVDINNWLFFGLEANLSGASPYEESLRVLKRVGGGEPVQLGRSVIVREPDLWRQFWLQVDRRGRFFAWGTLREGGIPRLILAGQDNDLATKGPLDDGKSGFYTVKVGGNAATITFDNFAAWVAPLEAILYEGLPLELRSDGVERQAPNGGWGEVVPEADYLTLSPAGMENRKNRIVFIASPHDPDLMGVGFPSELQVAVYARPRYRGVPDPAS